MMSQAKTARAKRMEDRSAAAKARREKLEEKRVEMEKNLEEGKKAVRRRMANEKAFAISVRRVPARGRVYLGEKAPRPYFWK